MPDGSWAQTRTYFNAMGWKTFVSNPGAPGTGTTYSSFRRLRPAAHDHPGRRRGAQRDPELCRHPAGRADLQGGDHRGERIVRDDHEIYDRFGRLYQVTEPNNTVTRYAMTRPITCRTSARASPAAPVPRTGGSTTTTAPADSETHPEKQPNVYGQGNSVDYPSYDARGHALRRIDGPNDLTFVYDAAERLTQVRESGPASPVARPTAAIAVSRASPTLPPTASTAPAAPTSAREARLRLALQLHRSAVQRDRRDQGDLHLLRPARRLSQKDTAQIFNGTTSETFRQTFTWNDLGNLASQTYPDCIAPSYCGASRRVL